jgi:molecular chaperone DnaJ
LRAVAKRDYYEVLGIERSASIEDIKRAYKKLAIEHHPDRNPDDPGAEERFKEASEAYAVLSDPEKRARFDRLGHAGFGGASGGFDTVDLGSMAEILEGLLGDVFGGRRRRGHRARDLTYDLEIEFAEAALGAERAIEVTRPTLCTSCAGSGAAPGSAPEQCPACRGRGTVRYQRGLFAASRPCQTCSGTGNRIETPCDECDGSGLQERVSELAVRIPAGVEDGSIRTVRGAGEQTRSGVGDLHVRVRVKPHPLFTRSGADVLCEIPIGFPQAVLGDQIDVPTLDGKVKMKLPPGTQSGKVFRLRGKGIPVFGGAGKGDQLVTVVVEVPEKITRKQRRLIEELAEEMGVDALPKQKSFLDKLKGLFE